MIVTYDHFECQINNYMHLFVPSGLIFRSFCCCFTRSDSVLKTTVLDRTETDAPRREKDGKTSNVLVVTVMDRFKR